MYVKEICIEGFKSYKHKTVISGFDPVFNAITGLNGSGKSNILDAICFVLGISNLTHIRVHNMQELVYKNGQAGVTMASVSIAFNNEDKKRSPFGYQIYDEIIVSRKIMIGGKIKYLINGVASTNARVQDLFCSVSLNINNPHFLIMQGKITKVLNMNPKDVLSLLEEATGTKIYDIKRNAALKKLELKENKLNEIDIIMNESIVPSLQRLRDEKANYLKYQKLKQELQKLSNFYTAYKFSVAQKSEDSCRNALLEFKSALEICQKEIEEIKHQTLKNTQCIVEMQEKIKDCVRLKNLEKILEETKKTMALHKSKFSICHSNIEEAKASSDAMIKHNEDDKEQLASNSACLQEMHESLEKVQNVFAKKEEEFLDSKKFFESCSTGIFTDKKGEAKTMSSEYNSLLKEKVALTSEIEQAVLKLEHAKNQLDERSSQKSMKDSEYHKLTNQRKNIQKTIQEITKKIDSMNYDSSIIKDLIQDQDKLKKKQDEINAKMNEFKNKWPNFVFNCEAEFDSKKVKGILGSFISVVSPEFEKALETAAGAKFFWVITDNEVTVKMIQAKKNIKRTTFIPLNKINSNVLSPIEVERAQKHVGKENVFPALSLINFDNELKPAMQFVFGNIFIAKSMDIAQKITFSKEISKRCITLDGDIFDPQGTVSGGFKQTNFSNLNIFSQLNTLKEEENAIKASLNEVTKKLNRQEKVESEWNNLKRILDLKTHEESVIGEKIKSTNHYLQEEELKNIKKVISKEEKTIQEVKEKMIELDQRIEKIKAKLDAMSNPKEDCIKNAEKMMLACKAAIEKVENEKESISQKIRSLEVECNDLKQSMAEFEKGLHSLSSEIERKMKEKEELEKEYAELEGVFEDHKKEYSSEKKKCAALNTELSEKQKESENLVNAKREKELQSQKLKHKMENVEKEMLVAVETLKKLLHSDPWIQETKHMFGKENSKFDFSQHSISEVKDKMEKVEEEIKCLSGNISEKAMDMLEVKENNYNELMEKKAKLFKDKCNLKLTIKKVDSCKQNELENAYTEVNKVFASIFGTLLPGACSKLDKVSSSILDGLVIKVGFGTLWKDSLTELSGGQRSVAALSLILAMLRFKPAPIYILDEIDAALDPSNTQNIGSIISKHFKGSQFLIVSLKDGMFKNANVLFKTALINGSSAVTSQRRENLIPGN